MIINEILQEKYKVQRELAKKSNTIHEYFMRSHQSAIAAARDYGLKLKYSKLPNQSFKKTA